MRQTNLTLKEIVDYLQNPGSPYRSCMLINEIGIICAEQKDEESEKALVSFLTNEDPSCRIISFCHLYSIEEMRKKHHVLLAKFRSSPENQQYLEEIDTMINNFQP